LTLALFTAMGSFEEIPIHIRASQNTGAKRDEIRQAFLHVVVYAGVPKANHAFKLAKETFNELGVEIWAKTYPRAATWPGIGVGNRLR
jgi:4-carboxymuconolactone decarboxylase